MSKEDDASPSVCLNCGAFVRASRDKKSIELCSDGAGMNSMGENDGFFSRDMFGDIFSGSTSSDGDRYVNGNANTMNNDDRKKRSAREKTIIDIDVLDDQ